MTHSPRSSFILHPSSFRRTRRAFSLIEILVVIGIIAALTAILLPVLSRARRTAARTRMASDLQAISTALEAYKADFGDYPRVEYTPGITNATDRPEPPTGAQILCWALIGPAGLNEPSGAVPPTGQHAIQDGADGPGFRTRCSMDATGKQVASGRVYGPYLPADKIHVGNPANPADKDPAKVLLWTLLDSEGHPILYAPASPKSLNPRDASPLPAAYIGQTDSTNRVQTFVWDLTDILGDNPSSNTLFIRPSDTLAKAAAYRISAMLGDTTGNGGAGNPDGRITNSENPATTGPYLLWMAGPDGLYGPTPESNFTPKDISNCDDVTNFNQ